MLKKIPVAQLRLGMHVHALEGPWLNHPFWRTRFLLSDSTDLHRLRSSPVTECVINTALGLDVEEVAAQAVTSPVIHEPVAEAEAPLLEHPRSLQEELQQAAAICGRGRATVVAMFNEARMGKALHAEKCLPLVEEITRSVQRNPTALISLARLKRQDDYSYMHSVAVCALMVALAHQVGMDDLQCRSAGFAGLMHDIGKAGIPAEILNKPGRLTDEERVIVQAHPEIGHRLLVEGRGSTPEILDVALHHHEKIDGSGYPHGLPGEGISSLARMGAICDVYDAVTSDRPYKKAWDPADALTRMAGWTGHFDEQLFAHFVRSLGIYPNGAVVRLESGFLAVVVEQNVQALAKPTVKTFFSTRSNMPTSPRVINLSLDACNDRVVGREPGATQRFPRLNELWVDPKILAHATRI